MMSATASATALATSTSTSSAHVSTQVFKTIWRIGAVVNFNTMSISVTWRNSTKCHNSRSSFTADSTYHENLTLPWKTKNSSRKGILGCAVPSTHPETGILYHRIIYCHIIIERTVHHTVLHISTDKSR